jgi:hypothetical protein
MGEIGEAQDAEYEGHPEGAEGELRAVGRGGNEDEVGEQGQRVEDFHSAPQERASYFGIRQQRLAGIGKAVLALHQHEAVIGDLQRLPAFCSTMRMAMPVRAISRIRSNRSSMTMGDTPAVGSSSMSSLGLVIRARPTATCWRWPPDSSPAGWLRFSLSTGNR